MSLRPVPARWFELLTTHEDLPVVLEALARTNNIELENRSAVQTRLDLTTMRPRIEAYARLEHRYHAYWPGPELSLPVQAGKPGDILDAALQQLRDWEPRAIPLIRQLEHVTGEYADTTVLVVLLQSPGLDDLDFSLLAASGPVLISRVYVLPAESAAWHPPATVLLRRVSLGAQEFIVATGPVDGMQALGRELATVRGHALQLPKALPPGRAAALRQLQERAVTLEMRAQEIRRQLDELASACRLAGAITDIKRLEWLMTHVSTLPVTENFAWITGWTRAERSDEPGAAVQAAGSHAIIGFPPAPHEIAAPMVMRNPWWARPFELFARLLGTPAADEADPSMLLAMLAPLLFGYMFGDLGHGLVLLLAGVLLHRRWPATRILIASGFSAMLFGLIFGSVFGHEDLVPALWLHPVEDPLPVLLVPLGGGILVLLLGLLLNAMEFRWRGRTAYWLQTEAAVPVLYLSVIASLFVPQALVICLLSVLWYCTGRLLLSSRPPLTTLLQAFGTLLESIFQLLVNTISFVRVGAFALAHGGLSLAFITLAGSTDNAAAAFLLLLLGNLVVILLEGLVVTIQTTRLILFEFFIRFLHCTGRMFQPLPVPVIQTNLRREP